MLVQFLGLVGTPECVVPILESGQDEAISEIAHALLEGLEDVTESALDAAWSGLGQELRRSACRVLGQTGGSVAGSRLREVLDDPDAELRAAAASALGARGAFEALPDLARRLEAAALEEEPEANEELAAVVDALVTLAADDAVLVAKAVNQLDPRLESPVEAVRRAAAAVLAELARPEDVDRLIALLKDPSAEVRRHAVGGLTRLDAAAVAEPLRLALADESPLVRMAAAAALGDSSPDAALDDLQRLLVDEDPRVCAAALRGIGSATAADRESDPEQRERALSFLGPALAEEGRGGVVAMAALEALGAIGGAEAARVAVAGLASAEPEVVQVSVACIGRHGEADTLPELIALVQHPAWAVRGEAIEALADRRIARALPAILRRRETEQDSFVREVIMRALRRLEE
jgi:HEAT repeat protein